ncbi:uncharacterized protein LOC143100176 [Alosa pseudoharengus]|uniref:uncharacterized protein LOC143100176 n=1 Tax=Alosa pseudoharengus TaxID=34774 RepID=UPI003F8B88F0
MKHLCGMFLLLCCTKVTKTEVLKVVAPLNPVLGVVGEDLILPCYLNNNVSAVDMEVQWLIERTNKLVHQYRRHMDITDDQLPAYRDRTSLFREELQRGNISLKLRLVSLSDTNTYKCYVKEGPATLEKNVKVEIHKFGNEPETSAVSHNNGSVTLLCVSTNWTTKPAIVWMDDKRNILAGDLEYCYSNDTTLYVQRSVTVQKKHGYSYTCRVSYRHHRKEKLIKVEWGWFDQHRHHWILFAPLCLVILILLSLLFCQAKEKMDKHNVLQMYKEFQISDSGVFSFYNELLIIHGHREMHIGEETPISSKKDYKEIKVEGIFKNQDGHLVILQGEPGYGKSLTAKKIMQDWAQGTFYSDMFELVVLLKCDELALSSQKKNLLELINDDQKYKSLINDILAESPHKVLILIDGLDEFTFTKEDIKSFPTKPHTPAPSKAILCGLLSGRMLPQSSLLVTTRPSASDRLNVLLKGRTWRFAEIRGFTEQGVEEYFKKFFNGDTIGVFQKVKNNKMLFTSCFNPFLCWITCTSLKRSTGSSDELDNVGTITCTALQRSTGSPDELDKVGTTTSIFWGFITILLQKQPQVDTRLGLLYQLHILAKGVIEEGKAQFDLSGSPLKNWNCVFRNINTDQKTTYRFIHQSFVEFFFALGYAIPGREEAQKVEELLISAQSNFLNSEFYLQPVLEFLFGLSNEAVRASLCSTCGLDSPTSSRQSSLCLQTQMKQWILARSDIFFRHKRFFLFPFHCLYELHNEQFVKEVMQLLGKIRFPYIPLTHTDCLVIRYCLEVYPSIKKLDLRHCSLTSEKLKLLQPVWATLECCKLWITADGLDNTDIFELVGILSSPSELNEQKSVNLQFLSVKSFTLDTASNLLKVFQRTKHLFCMSLEMDETAGADSFCSSFSAERDELLFTLTVGFHKAKHKDPQPEILLITLVLPAAEAPREASSEPAYDWAKLVQDVQSLRQGNSLQCPIIPDLKKLEIEVNYLPQDWASDILCYIHTDEKTLCNLMDINVWAADKINSGGAGAFSSLKLKRITDETFRLKTRVSEDKKNPVSRPRKPSNLLSTLPEITETDSGGMRILNALPQKFASFIRNFSSDESTISLILPTAEESSHDKSSDLLSKIIRLGALSENNKEECVRALLSISNMEDMKLRVKCIPESLATWILCSSNNYQKMHVALETQPDGDVDSLCSSLIVEKDLIVRKDKKKCVDFGLKIMDGRMSSSHFTAPVVSGITLHSESDPLVPLNMDWQRFFGTFYTLRNITKSSPDGDDHVGALLSSLSCLSGLKTVDLLVSCLSDSLINSIKSFMKDCPSIQETRVSCGENRHFGNIITWSGEGEEVNGKFGFTITINREQVAASLTANHRNKEELDKCVQALISIPNVEKKLRVTSISESLATWIFSFCNNHQNIVVAIVAQPDRDVDRFLPRRIMEKDQGKFQLSVRGDRMSSSSDTELKSLMSRLIVRKDKGKFQLSVWDKRMSSSPETTVLSGIDLHSESDPLDMDWQHFFRIFYTLRNITKSSPSVDDHVGALLSSLSCLRGLKTVDLFVSCLSDSLRNSIKSFMKDCPSIQETRVSCGKNVLSEDGISWIEEGEKVKFHN